MKMVWNICHVLLINILTSPRSSMLFNHICFLYDARYVYYHSKYKFKFRVFEIGFQLINIIINDARDSSVSRRCEGLDATRL